MTIPFSGFGDPSKFRGFEVVSVSIHLVNGQQIHGTTTLIDALRKSCTQASEQGLIASFAATPVIRMSYN